jgi:phosphatidylserine/phosphatidylglycerophosphate/cardiolipin synthase-like enzyme
MKTQANETPYGAGPEAIAPARLLADQAFARAAGAPLVAGNSIRILKDAEQNYPAWLEAINTAERTIHFESYIIHADETGHKFVETLAAKAREGVRVRLIYDWMGALGYASGRFRRGLRQAGVEVRCFNPPRFDSPLGWLSRDHRKVIVVDGMRAFVTGLCVGQRWVGYPERGIEPWRDTGVELRGPAVADVESAFAQSWADAGGAPIPLDELSDKSLLPPAGDVIRDVPQRPRAFDRDRPEREEQSACVGRTRAVTPGQRKGTRKRWACGGGAVRVGNAVGAAITNHREPGPAEAKSWRARVRCRPRSQ